ncbi:MAG: hypothetical protein AAGH89_08335 [Verrucomicrobiota bacterium]
MKLPFPLFAAALFRIRILIVSSFMGLTISGNSLLAQQSSLQLDWEFEISEGEATRDIEVPKDGLIWIRPIQVPEGLEFFAEILNAESRDRKRMEFRVPKGTHGLKIWERTAQAPPGKAKFRVYFVAETDTSEPENDRSSRPREVRVSDSIPVRLYPTGEVDFLRVNPGKRGYISVDAPQPPEGLNLWPELADASGNSLGLGTGHTPIGGPVTIRVADRWSAFGSLEPFKLRVRFVPEMDCAEPNNTPEEAVETRFGTWHEAAIMPQGDTDFFRIKSNEPGYLQIRAYDPPEFNLLWEMFDANSNLSIADGWIMPIPEGEFYLRLKAEDETQFSAKPFRFQIVWRAIERITPRHNKVDEATEVAAGESVRLRIASPGEEDHLAVRVDRPSIVWFHGKLPPGLDALFQTKGGREGNPLWLRDDRGLISASFLERNKNYTVEPATIWTDVEPDLDSNEPNDSRDVRKTLEVGRPEPLYLYPGNDIDWFAFRLRKAGAVQFRILSPEGRLDDFEQGIEFGITDEKGQPLAQRIGVSTSGYSWVAEPIDLPKGKFGIWLKGRWGGFSSHPLRLLAYPAEEVPESIAQTGIQVVSLGSGEKLTQLRGITEAAGAEFVTPAEVGGEPQVVANLNTSAPPEKSGSYWWFWILVVLLIIWLFRKMSGPSRRRGKKFSSLTG